MGVRLRKGGRARQQGILAVIDGAHAPGQLPLDLVALDADCYTGNCHKWMCAPKGAGFLYVQAHMQAIIEPAVISWGWLPGAPFAKRNGWQGTRDIAAYLSVPSAIQFQHDHDGATARPSVRQRHDLRPQARNVQKYHTWEVWLAATIQSV